MASRNADATADPTNIVTELGLTLGRWYTIQNVDSNATIYLREAAVKPPTGLRAFIFVPGAHGTFSPDANVGIWIWCSPLAISAKAIVNEAP